MSENISIPVYKKSEDILDFDYLKQRGLSLIQKYSGKVWTDFNIHDPGITILETLCFGLTELGYKCRYPIEDIFILPGEEDKKETTDFTSLLYTRPITNNDYRKLILDIVGVRNVFISKDTEIPEIKGMWKILAEINPIITKEDATSQILRELNKNRNLCEDFAPIEFVKYDKLKFVIEIELGQVSDLKFLTHSIFGVLEENLNPKSKVYSANELLDNGFRIEEILNGPNLKNGVILDEELDKLVQRKSVFVSDMYKLLMDIEGVNFVRKLRIIDSEGKVHKWVCPIKEGRIATLDISNIDLKFFKEGKEYKIPFAFSKTFDKEMYHVSVLTNKKSIRSKGKKGEYVDVASYTSVQNDMPEIFGVGMAGLPSNSTKLRRAQAKQLKAYLAVFDQLNANFLSQLENLANIFSLKPIKQTYYTQVLRDTPGMNVLYVPFVQKCQAEGVDINNSKAVNELWKSEKEQIWSTLEDEIQRISENEYEFVHRRNKILDHLLARFSYNIEDEFKSSESEIEEIKKLIDKKIDLLRNINTVTTDRILSVNLDKIETLTQNISGFHLRLQKKLGISPSPMRIDAEWEHLSEKPEDNSENYFEIFETSKSDATRLLFEFGDNEENYIIEPFGDSFKVLLTNNHRQIGEFSKEYRSKKDAEKEIPGLVNFVESQNQYFNTVFCFEHILLRPPEFSEAFNIQLIDETGRIIFRNEKPLTLAQRKKLESNVFKFGLNINNYVVQEVGYKQFKFELLNNAKGVIVESELFSSTKEEAIANITSAVGCLQKASEDVAYKNTVINYSTEAIIPGYTFDDVYSNFVTYAIPAWVKPFQGNLNRSRFEMQLLENTPAHIFANIKWMEYEELLQAVNLYYDILLLPKDDEELADLLYDMQKDLLKILL
jgi:hypothetical protein